MSTTGVVFVLRVEADRLIEEMEIGNGITLMKEYFDERLAGRTQFSCFVAYINITRAAAKLRYSQADAIHIYSLSPSPILDGGFFCIPTEKLRQIDLEKGEELVKIIGKVMSKNIQVDSSKRPTATKKAQSPPVASPSKLKASESSTEAASKPQNKKVQPAKSGTLDWSKAKPKAAKEERKEIKVEAKPKQPLKPSIATKADEKPVKKEETETLIKKAQPKRGTKRKSASALISDSEDDSSSSRSKPPPKKEPEVKVKKGVVVSEDEEDDDDMPRIATRKPSRVGRLHPLNS
ncbi:uncharacterized protein ARMOST_06531 [Armillaria ostoyae]|uniref:Uncharacterized protein n=1 Tax=Armillaria ostoyae TaxID=47428 RepID=A0A284R3C5_ARMOS|nr:uncharacterized protein ARMOST_06531 [Armillaria ostoyae]